MLPRFGEIAGPMKESRKLLPEIVVIGIPPHRRFQGVVGLGLAGPRRARRPDLAEHHFGELGPGLVVVVPQSDVPRIEPDGLVRAPLLGALAGENENVVGIAVDLVPVDRVDAYCPSEEEDGDDDQEFEVDGFHGDDGPLTCGSFAWPRGWASSSEPAGRDREPTRRNSRDEPVSVHTRIESAHCDGRPKYDRRPNMTGDMEIVQPSARHSSWAPADPIDRPGRSCVLSVGAVWGEETGRPGT